MNNIANDRSRTTTIGPAFNEKSCLLKPGSVGAAIALNSVC